MLVRGVLGGRVGEHLHLVEPVHPDDALGVLAVGAGLAAKAGGEPGVAQRQGAGVEDLAAVVAGQRHLGRADQVQLVLGQPVHLGGVRAEEAGALHRSPA